MYERPLAYVCSPLKGEIEANLTKAKQYARKVFEAGYEPFVPHLYYTGFLNDRKAEERQAGIAMGLNHLKKCRILVVCTDKISDGMLTEINEAYRLSIPVVNLSGLQLYASIMTQTKKK